MGKCTLPHGTGHLIAWRMPPCMDVMHYHSKGPAMSLLHACMHVRDAYIYVPVLHGHTLSESARQTFHAPCMRSCMQTWHIKATPLTWDGLAHPRAGRQARERARQVSIVKKQRQIEDKRSRMGVPLSHDEAARRIQAALRGFIWRRRIKEISDQELQFIGMKPKVAGGGEKWGGGRNE